jgi:uncharacterized membrane protein (UPF0127 family)
MSAIEFSGLNLQTGALLGLPVMLALRPVGSVHTFFMRMPIDVVFLDGAGMALGVRRSLPPWRIAAGGTRARQTLELPGGTVRRLRLQPGDRVVGDRGRWRLQRGTGDSAINARFVAGARRTGPRKQE